MATTVICNSCKNNASIDNVRYAENGKDLVCMPCFEQIPSGLPRAPVQREKYHCLSCNYKFSYRKESRLNRKCPYCSSQNITLRSSVTSHTVLQDVTENPDFVFSTR